jgi:hypothetical protein
MSAIVPVVLVYPVKSMVNLYLCSNMVLASPHLWSVPRTPVTRADFLPTVDESDS